MRHSVVILASRKGVVLTVSMAGLPPPFTVLRWQPPVKPISTCNSCRPARIRDGGRDTAVPPPLWWNCRRDRPLLPSIRSIKVDVLNSEGMIRHSFSANDADGVWLRPEGTVRVGHGRGPQQLDLRRPDGDGQLQMCWTPKAKFLKSESQVEPFSQPEADHVVGTQVELGSGREGCEGRGNA